MSTTSETSQVTGTKDKNYNLIWFTEQCLENALRLENLHPGRRTRRRQRSRRAVPQGAVRQPEGRRRGQEPPGQPDQVAMQVSAATQNALPCGVSEHDPVEILTEAVAAGFASAQPTSRLTSASMSAAEKSMWTWFFPASDRRPSETPAADLSARITMTKKPGATAFIVPSTASPTSRPAVSGSVQSNVIDSTLRVMARP